MRAEEFIAELGDAPAAYEPNSRRKRSLFHSTVGDHWVDVHFDRSDLNDTLHITFTVDGDYEAPSHPGSASKHVVKILSTVLNVIRDQLPNYMKKSRPPAVSFTAKENNRAGLYRKYFVPVIQAILGPRWQHEEYNTMGQTVFHWRPVAKKGSVSEDAVHRGGIDVEEHEDAEDPSAIWITASTHGRDLGRVKFHRSGDTLTAQELEVKPEYRSQGIARIMYDYAKELGYRVLRSAEQTDAGAGFWDKYRGRTGVWESMLDEVNSPGELAIDPGLIDRFTSKGWQIAGEGRDQMVFMKPGSNTVLKVVGSGSLPRQAEIRRYVNFFRANQRNPHFPRVGPDRELDWKGQKYYAYTQERLQALPGDEAVMDYLEMAMGELGHGEEPDLARVPKGLTIEDIEGLTAAVDHMFESGLGGQYGFDLANLANIMQRSNGQLVIVDPFSGFDDELDEAINPETLEPGFELKRTMKNGLIIRARGRKRYPDMPDVIGLDVEIFDPRNDPSLRWPVADTHFKAKQDPDTGEWYLSSLSTGTKEEYRRQGLASAMYNFARVLGNELRASRIQSRAGEDFWKKGAAGQGRALELQPGIELTAEHFADGKVKGKSRPGRVKRAGASCKGSVTDLRARAKKYGGERGKMYRWCLNMKAGRKK